METESPSIHMPLQPSPLIFGGGEMGERIRGFDWGKTSIGPLEAWPQALLVTLNMMLQSPVPMVLLWNEDGVMLYNDAYSYFAGGRHPFLLGSKVVEGWPEVADFNRNVMDKGLKGQTLSYKDQQLTLYRNNIPEEVWMDLNYSPILNEYGKPAGVLAIVVETTTRVTAEKEKAKAEEHFQLAMSAAGMVGTFDWHIPADTMYADERFALLFSVDPEKAKQGTSLASYVAAIHPDDQAPVEKGINKTIETRSTYREEYRLIQKDGSIRWVLAQGECLYDEENRPVRFPGVVVDITEQKQTEQALRESEARFRNLADTAPIYMAMADETGNAAYFNKPWLEFTGRTMDEMRGLGWLCTVHPEDAPKFERDFKHAFQHQLPINEQYRFLRADGEYRWMLAVGAPRLTEGGKFVGYFGTYTDFHELKQAQDAIKASEERFRIMANASPHFIWELSPEGIPLYVNKSALEYVGKTLEEYIQEPWSVYLPPEEEEWITAAIMDAVAQRKSYRLEHRIRNASGEYRWFISSADPSFLPDGELYRYIGSAIDIHDRKQAEEALSRQHALVEEYARRLESSNKDLSQFASVVSHDLQAPLRKVFMFADVLKEREAANLSDQGRDYLERMQRSTNRMQELITDLLALSRIDRSETPFDWMNLKDVITAVLDDLAFDIQQTNARIDVDAPIELIADQQQISQMMANLITNALKYRRPEVSPHLQINAQQLDAQYVQISVQDNGIGIEADYFSKIFEIFQRLHNDSQYSGTGIGLAIVKRIVDRHRGLIRLESTPGEGSTFIVTLPLKQPVQTSH